MVKFRDNLEFKYFENKLAVIDLDLKEISLCEDTAFFILKRLIDDLSYEEIIKELIKIYDISLKELKKEFYGFVSSLIEKRWIIEI